MASVLPLMFASVSTGGPDPAALSQIVVMSIVVPVMEIVLHQTHVSVMTVTKEWRVMPH